MFSKCIIIIRQNWWFYVFFAVVMLIVAGVVDSGYFKSASNTSTTVVWLFLALFVHRAALYNIKFGAANADGTKDLSFRGFVLKALALLGLSALLSAPVLIWAHSSEGNAAASQAPEIPGLFPFLGAFLLIYAALLSLVGSWLPATVYKQNTGLVAALKRGIGNFLPVFMRIAPTLFLASVLQFSLLIAAGMLGFQSVVILNGVPNIGGAAITIFATLIEAFSITLISVILSHYYLKAEGIDPDPDANRLASPLPAIGAAEVRRTFGKRM